MLQRCIPLQEYCSFAHQAQAHAAHAHQAERGFTKALAHGQRGTDDVCALQQEDIANVDVVGRHIHTEQLDVARLFLQAHGTVGTRHCVLKRHSMIVQTLTCGMPLDQQAPKYIYFT